jgi:hypothetical protein
VLVIRKDIDVSDDCSPMQFAKYGYTGPELALQTTSSMISRPQVPDGHARRSTMKLRMMIARTLLISTLAAIPATLMAAGPQGGGGGSMAQRGQTQSIQARDQVRSQDQLRTQQQLQKQEQLRTRQQLHKQEQLGSQDRVSVGAETQSQKRTRSRNGK